jgi:hypothetical protein
MTKQTAIILVGVAILGALAGLGLKALAAGIPSPTSLYYAGTLTETGVPVNGTRAITVNLWPDGTTSSTALCTTVASTVNVNNGRFRIPLSSTCKTAINQNANAWVEVIDGTTSLGRSPVGAVPYAVESDHAVSATTATTAASAVAAGTANAAGGTLATVISGLQAQVHTASAFRARLTTPIAVSSGTLTSVPFDTVEFDLNTEYSAATGVFAPKISGIYIIICQFQYVMSTNTSACSATITKNGADFIESDSPTLPPISGGDAHCDAEVTTTVQAAAGDAFTCSAYQFSAAAATASVDQTTMRNTFSAARLY